MVILIGGFMKVKYLGFELGTKKNKIKIKEFIDKNLDFIDEDILERDFIIDAETNEQYYKGLILTVKDQKAFCKLQGSRDDLQIKVENLDGSEQLIEFNFFIINKTTGRGLYQFYYQSTSLNKFGEILKRKFVEYRDSLKTDEIHINISSGKSDKASRSIANKKYHDLLIFEMLFKTQTLKDLLLKCKKIKSFEYEFCSYDRMEEACVPLAALAKKMRQKVTFSQPNLVQNISESISQLISDQEPDKGTVIVIDEFDQEMPYKLLDTPDLFHEEEFDELVQKLNDIKVGNFTDSKILDEMIKISKSKEI